MQNVEWVMGEWVIPLRLLRLLEHLAVLISSKQEPLVPFFMDLKMLLLDIVSFV